MKLAHISINSSKIKKIKKNYAQGKKIPWWAKAAIKIFLSLFPFTYHFWEKLNIFRHGDYHKSPKQIQAVFDRHVNYYKSNLRGDPVVMLEMGPGDTLAHCISGKCKNLKKFFFIDVGDFAMKEVQHYKDFSEYLGINLKSETFLGLLNETNSIYHTDGLDSFSYIEDEVVDFSFSHAVIEHIEREEFQKTLKELYRVHKKHSFSSHWVDLHDHLGGSLNNLRFSNKFWETKLIKNSGFYTNRLRMSEIVTIAKDSGFEVKIEEAYSWEKAPISKSSMHSSFHRFSEEEMRICTFLMFLFKK